MNHIQVLARSQSCFKVNYIFFLLTQFCGEAVVSPARVSWCVSQHVSGGASLPG